MKKNLSENLNYYRADLVRVIDGDTLVVNIDKGFHCFFNKQRLRLAGINAPESRGKSRAEGKRSTAALEDLLALSSDMIVHTIEEDAFGRWLASVYVLIGIDWVDVSAWMIENGYATFYGGPR